MFDKTRGEDSGPPGAPITAPPRRAGPGSLSPPDRPPEEDGRLGHPRAGARHGARPLAGSGSEQGLWVEGRASPTSPADERVHRPLGRSETSPSRSWAARRATAAEVNEPGRRRRTHR